MPYSDRLDNLSFWYRQLWAESIGKNKMGITPMNALGTVDQHSHFSYTLTVHLINFLHLFLKKKIKKKLRL